MVTIPCPFLSRPGNFLAIFKGVFQPLQVTKLNSSGDDWEEYERLSSFFGWQKMHYPAQSLTVRPRKKKDGWKMYFLLGPFVTFQGLKKLTLKLREGTWT